MGTIYAQGGITSDFGGVDLRDFVKIQEDGSLDASRFE
jgi:hypothetical protein